MIRHQLARILSAIADRIEPPCQQPEIQYVYVYGTLPATTTQPWYQSPWISSPNTCGY